MVTDEGRVSIFRHFSRSGAVSALFFGYALVTACGGRSALVDDSEFEGDGGQDGGVGGAYANGGTNTQGGRAGKGSGGTVGKAGSFGTGGFVAVSGASFGGNFTGGSGGFAGVPYGGFAGVSYGGFAGVPYGGFAGTFAGAGGSIYPAGAGGSFGKAGFGGMGPQPNVNEACALACKHMSPVCLLDQTVGGCYQACALTGSAYPVCSVHFASYAYCLADAMWPGAACYIDGSGHCAGDGCLDQAEARCGPHLTDWTNCSEGQSCRFGGATSTATYCQLLTSCIDNFYQTDCYPTVETGSGNWDCYCYGNRVLFGRSYVSPADGDPCYAGAAKCGVPGTY